MSSTHTTIARIPPRLRARGAALLVSEPYGKGDEAAGRQMLEAAVKHGIDLSNLWGSFDQSEKSVREACLLVPGAGRTAVVFLSTPPAGDQDRIDELGAVLSAALSNTEGDIAIAQAILDVDEPASAQALTAGGFLCAGSLQYLRRPPTPIENPPDPGSGWPDGITVTLTDPSNDADLAAALEASYEQTLDCPELCGLRATHDVISSHRASGVWDPALWWIVRHEGTPVGAALLNHNPSQANSELVYMGLAPSVRGLGIASRLLDLGLYTTLSKARFPVTCAVDERNIPAQKLYDRAGFKVFDRRVAYVRPIA